MTIMAESLLYDRCCSWIVFDFNQASSKMILVSANSFANRCQWVTKIVITREVLANACCQFWSLYDLKSPVPKLSAKLLTLALWKYYQTNRHNYYSNPVPTQIYGKCPFLQIWSDVITCIYFMIGCTRTDGNCWSF